MKKIIFAVEDVIDTQSKTNMTDPIKIIEIKGRGLIFKDINGQIYHPFSQSTARNLIKEKSWKLLKDNK